MAVGFRRPPTATRGNDAAAASKLEVRSAAEPLGRPSSIDFLTIGRIQRNDGTRAFDWLGPLVGIQMHEETLLPQLQQIVARKAVRHRHTSAAEVTLPTTHKTARRRMP